MKLYISQGSNPRVVNYFLAEKGITLNKVEVDIAKGENLQPDYLRRNSLGQMPVLELDSGQCISQITAICEYLEELHPEPPLIGATPEQRAETRMWLRRIDLLLMEPLGCAFRYSTGLPYYQTRTHCIPHAVEDFKAIARQNLAWLESELDDKSWICGKRFTLADIQLFCFLDFAVRSGQPLDPNNAHVARWFERARSRLAAD